MTDTPTYKAELSDAAGLISWDNGAFTFDVTEPVRIDPVGGKLRITVEPISE